MRKQLTDEEISTFRNKAVRCAEKLFAADGVEHVSMRQIANAMGYSQTALYRYFSNKEEILAAMRTAALNRFCNALEGAFDPKVDARTNARRVGRAYMQFPLDEPDSYRLIFATRYPSETRFPDYERTMSRFHGTMTSYVKALIAEGLIEGNPIELGRLFSVAAQGVVMAHLNGTIASVRARDRLYQAMMKTIYRGMRATKVEPQLVTKPIRFKT